MSAGARALIAQQEQRRRRLLIQLGPDPRTFGRAGHALPESTVQSHGQTQERESSSGEREASSSGAPAEPLPMSLSERQALAMLKRRHPTAMYFALQSRKTPQRKTLPWGLLQEPSPPPTALAPGGAEDEAGGRRASMGMQADVKSAYGGILYPPGHGGTPRHLDEQLSRVPLVRGFGAPFEAVYSSSEGGSGTTLHRARPGQLPPFGPNQYRSGICTADAAGPPLAGSGAAGREAQADISIGSSGRSPAPGSAGSSGPTGTGVLPDLECYARRSQSATASGSAAAAKAAAAAAAACPEVKEEGVMDDFTPGFRNLAALLTMLDGVLFPHPPPPPELPVPYGSRPVAASTPRPSTRVSNLLALADPQRSKLFRTVFYGTRHLLQIEECAQASGRADLRQLRVDQFRASSSHDELQAAASAHRVNAFFEKHELMRWMQDALASGDVGPKDVVLCLQSHMACRPGPGGNASGDAGRGPSGSSPPSSSLPAARKLGGRWPELLILADGSDEDMEQVAIFAVQGYLLYVADHEGRDIDLNLDPLECAAAAFCCCIARAQGTFERLSVRHLFWALRLGFLPDARWFLQQGGGDIRADTTSRGEPRLPPSDSSRFSADFLRTVASRVLDEPVAVAGWAELARAVTHGSDLTPHIQYLMLAEAYCSRAKVSSLTGAGREAEGARRELELAQAGGQDGELELGDVAEWESELQARDWDWDSGQWARECEKDRRRRPRVQQLRRWVDTSDGASGSDTSGAPSLSDVSASSPSAAAFLAGSHDPVLYIHAVELVDTMIQIFTHPYRTAAAECIDSDVGEGHDGDGGGGACGAARAGLGESLEQAGSSLVLQLSSQEQVLLLLLWMAHGRLSLEPGAIVLQPTVDMAASGAAMDVVAAARRGAAGGVPEAAGPVTAARSGGGGCAGKKQQQQREREQQQRVTLVATRVVGALPETSDVGYKWNWIRERILVVTATSKLGAQVKVLVDGLVKRRLMFLWLQCRGVEGLRRMMTALAQTRRAMLEVGRDLCFVPIGVLDWGDRQQDQPHGRDGAADSDNRRRRRDAASPSKPKPKETLSPLLEKLNDRVGACARPHEPGQAPWPEAAAAGGLRLSQPQRPQAMMEFDMACQHAAQLMAAVESPAAVDAALDAAGASTGVGSGVSQLAAALREGLHIEFQVIECAPDRPWELVRPEVSERLLKELAKKQSRQQKESALRGRGEC